MFNVIVIADRTAHRNVLKGLAVAIEDGVEVTSFDASEPAWKGFEEALPDLVIADFRSPDIEGADFVQAFRSFPNAEDIPVLVITDQEKRDDCHGLLEAGATDFLLNPLDRTEFNVRARNLLTIRKQQRLLRSNIRSAHEQLDARQDRRGGASSEQPWHRLINSTSALINSVNREGQLTQVNQYHEQIFGIDPANAIGQRFEVLYGEDEATCHHVRNAKVFETGKTLESFEQDLTLPDHGKRHRFLVTKSPLFDENGHVAEVVTLSQNITGKGPLDVDASGRENRDPLTDLPNRGVYRNYLENALIRALRREGRSALLLVDLDRFKGVNDAFGLTFGDLLLREVSKRLAQHLREIDVVGHLGGDQFAILQTDITSQEESRTLAMQLNECFSKPFFVSGEELHISASIGITMFPADGYKADRLLKNAELAMYRSKAIGRNAICFYAPRMNFAARRTGLLERELRQAVADDQFTVHYQPCRAIRDDRITGMEALLRWRHPRRGMVRPTEFIGLAETIGLINAITECVLDQSCRQHRSWAEEGLPPLRLAVNLSPIQFREEGVVDLVKTVLERTGIAPETLEIELTEGVMLENSKVALDSLTRLNDLGITFSLDDFGTGYSSLSYVRRLPVQRLKIDQSFVHRLGQNGQDDAIVRAIIDLGHSLDLKITAEGVETNEQLDRLKALGCDEVQGDLISPPLPADAFAALFSEMDSSAMAAG